MVSLRDFIINEETIESISNEEVLLKHLEEGKSLQDIFGFSDETTAEFYDAAKNVLEQKRFTDAIDAFVFLTTINPYISDFWTGLGLAQQNNNDHDAALFSYNVAFTIEEGEIYPYILAAQCCIEMKNFDKAIEILDVAENCAEEHSNEGDDYQKLKEDAQAAKLYVRQQQKKG